MTEPVQKKSRIDVRFLLALAFVVGLGVLAINQDRPSAGAGGAGSEPTSAASRCTSVPASIVANIAMGVGDGNALGKAAAVKSTDYENVWMVAAVIEGAGLTGDAGVWALNDLSGGGLILSVDGFANNFSDWGRLEGASIADDGAQEAKECAES